MLSSGPCSSEGVLLLPFDFPAVGVVRGLHDIILVWLALSALANNHFHLASHGCNKWEMKRTAGLYMLWMHVDGSP